MELLSEEERYEAGVIPHDLVIRLGETAVKDFEFPDAEDPAPS
jgi:hypothetical protein